MWPLLTALVTLTAGSAGPHPVRPADTTASTAAHEVPAGASLAPSADTAAPDDSRVAPPADGFLPTDASALDAPDVPPDVLAPLDLAPPPALPLLALATPADLTRHRPLPPDAPVLPELDRRARWRVPVTHTASLFIGMRVGLSVLWPRAYDPSRLDASAQHLAAAYTRPPQFRRGAPLLESDGDPWLLNTVGHGLFGAEVYGRFRQCGHAPVAAFLAAATASTAWEYGPEAFHQRPSALDLVWTPVAGALIGELRVTALRALTPSPGARPGPVRAVLRTLVDPLGTLERTVLGTGC